MGMWKKPDLTINGYGSILREYFEGTSQVDICAELGLHSNFISGLLNGTSVGNRDKVERLLNHIGVPEKVAAKLIVDIDRQRQVPVIKNELIGPRVRAIRTLKKLTCNDLANDKLTYITITQLEHGRSTCGIHRAKLLTEACGEDVRGLDGSNDAVYEILKNHSRKDILTAAFHILNLIDGNL